MSLMTYYLRVMSYSTWISLPSSSYIGHNLTVSRVLNYIVYMLTFKSIQQEIKEVASHIKENCQRRYYTQ